MVCQGVPLEGMAGYEADKYLARFDPDARPPLVEWTENKSAAMKFESAAEGLDAWRRQSTTVPLRPDGRPNRPLAAFSVSFESDDE